MVGRNKCKKICINCLISVIEILQEKMYSFYFYVIFIDIEIVDISVGTKLQKRKRNDIKKNYEFFTFHA